MSTRDDSRSRRAFIGDAGRAASVAALAACIPPATLSATSMGGARDASSHDSEFDLAWMETLRSATDRAVFDWPSLGDPADPAVLEIADRYLDGCVAALPPNSYVARAVLNI